MQRKSAGTQVKHVGAGHVRRHKVGSTLHPLKTQGTNTGQGLHGKRFCQAGHAFDNRMTAANQHEEQLVDKLALADHGFGEFLTNLRGKLREILHGYFFSFRIAGRIVSLAACRSSFCTRSKASLRGSFSKWLALAACCSQSAMLDSFQPSRSSAAWPSS